MKYLFLIGVVIISINAYDPTPSSRFKDEDAESEDGPFQDPTPSEALNDEEADYNDGPAQDPTPSAALNDEDTEYEDAPVFNENADAIDLETLLDDDADGKVETDSGYRKKESDPKWKFIYERRRRYKK